MLSVNLNNLNRIDQLDLDRRIEAHPFGNEVRSDRADRQADRSRFPREPASFLVTSPLGQYLASRRYRRCDCLRFDIRQSLRCQVQ